MLRNGFKVFSGPFKGMYFLIMLNMHQTIGEHKQMSWSCASCRTRHRRQLVMVGDRPRSRADSCEPDTERRRSGGQ